jgi:hypothetical protein
MGILLKWVQKIVHLVIWVLADFKLVTYSLLGQAEPPRARKKTHACL